MHLETLSKEGEEEIKGLEKLKKAFKKAYKHIFDKKEMTPEMLQDKPVQQCIKATERVFTVIVEKHISSESPSDFRKSIVRDLSIFSGFKTYHHLKETAEQVFRGDGSIKAWGEFLKDTSKIFEKYNKNWLRAEYQFATASAQMADKWEKIIEQKDRYDLVYSTAGDNQVRPDHAILDGTCLPADDPAWATIYPPNGWGCRCTVHQILKGSREYSDSNAAVQKMLEMTKGKEEIFRFNSGIEGRLFPKTHPYYGKNGYEHCKINKLAGKLESNEECEVYYNLLRKEEYDEEGYTSQKSPKGNNLKVHINADHSEIEDNIRTGFILIDEFSDLDIKVREHVTKHRVKNAEYLINGFLGDAKRVKSEKGITSGFKAAKEQECRYVIIDYDKEKRGKKISYKKTAKELANRAVIDFDTGIIKEVFVVHNGRAVRFDKDIIRDQEMMIEMMIEKGL